MKYIALTLSFVLINTISLCCKNQKDIDFLNPKNRTSALTLTDGERKMLPCFSGESEIYLYTVYFLGRTEEERTFWDVYNENGFWKGKDSEQAHLYAKDMERCIDARIKRYNIFAIAIDKGMIKETTEDEFLPDSNAVYKTYLLTDGKWIITDSFKVQDTPKETMEYLMNVLDKRSTNKLLGDSSVSVPNFSNSVNTSCATGSEECILEKLTTNYYSLLSNRPSFVLKLDKKHKLLLRTYKEKDSIEEHIRTYALLHTNNLASDSILCYEYYNNANTLSSYEQIYYIDISQRKIWTVMLIYDEDSTEADSANIYTIDLKTNRFRKKVCNNKDNE